jgi:asparagine synthase (glutamine-hydrolysing)
MSDLRLRFADPHVQVVTRPGSTWFASGLVARPGVRFDPDDGGPSGPEAALCARLGDATVVRVDHPDGLAREVQVWRGATSSYEVHHAPLPGGGTVVSDHFRDAVAFVAPDERQPTEAVTIDHFLFRHARGRETYARGIGRVGPGEHARIDPATGRADAVIFDRLVSRHEPRPVHEYVADLDGALATELDHLRHAPGAVLMLSGGMDSTLMQSYFGHDVPALHVQADSDDFHLGGGYLDAVAAALGIEPERVVVPTDDFLGDLERAVDARGLPPHFPQWVTLGRVYERDHDVFVIGERAGGYARFGGRLPYRARRFARRPGSFVQPALRLAAITNRPHRLRLLADQAPALGRDPMSPDGWGAQMPQSYGDRGWVERTFGRGAVRARYEARLAHVRDHVELLPSTADPYFRHLEIARWLEFYNENDSQFRSLAFAKGKALVDPFTSRTVVDAMLAVPPTERFEQGLHSKYIVESLLRSRVPAYPPTATKDDIVVPFRRYLDGGPLAELWQRYEVPDLFTGRDRTALLEHPTEPAWTAIAWAVWQARIARNDALQPLASMREARWPVGAPTAVTV